MGKWQTVSTVRNYFIQDQDDPTQWWKRASVETTYDYSVDPIQMRVVGIKLDKDGNVLETANTLYNMVVDGDTTTVTIDEG